ncbi:hypothetical protein OHB41_34000 [Streptomyces sp. NBC_01571]|uniref:hypothetical protein n=1 Tax=Streptomyces sp. NBC_01571 TaxID=2975883 RepID=UPI00224DD102|nr:hypothetical protein [Streptomyces sp. NBC_01571]MCX4578116.1 hypothetical protein [Streptomyces sp. NBC_01571]
MRIRMLVQMPPGATRNGVPWPDEGAVEDITTGEAQHLVASGIAEEVEDDTSPAPRRRTKKEAAE